MKWFPLWAKETQSSIFVMMITFPKLFKSPFIMRVKIILSF